MEMLAKLRSLKKGIISIKNKDQKGFLWCHVRHINPVKVHLERITREDKKLAKHLDYDGNDFPVQEKKFAVLELSKWLMYDLHYNFNKKHFDFESLFTDTDSITYEIKPAVYEELFKRKHLFDFSNLRKNPKFFDEPDKKVLVK